MRRCVEKETGKEFACKIMDINGDPSENEGTALRESTIREIAILRRVAGHPYISRLIFFYILIEADFNCIFFYQLNSMMCLNQKLSYS